MSKSKQFNTADLTNPDHLKQHGLKLKGRQVVTDDGDEVVIGELSDEEYKSVGGK